MIRNILLTGTLVTLLCGMGIAEEKLYVFYPTMARPQAVQEKMQNSLGGVTVTVFGRFNDFNKKIEMEPPDAVITKTAVIKELLGFTVALNGIRKGKTRESYVIMSIKEPITTASITGETVIGVIDVRGRKGMKAFAAELFPNVPRLKRVTKVEDLLPLLTFNMAAGILIEDVFVDYFRKTSQLEFSIRPISGGKGGIIAVGVKGNAGVSKTVGALRKADKSICALFKVEAWK